MSATPSKRAGKDRDRDIEAYIGTLRNLGEADIQACYNFMPVFGWRRAELARAA